MAAWICLTGKRLRFPIFFISLLLPAVIAAAQVSFGAAPASVSFGTQALGSVSAAQTLSFQIAAGTKVGSVAVLTKGVAGLDFANAAGSTCAGQSYASTTSCQVNVTFAPTAAGLRMGAAVFFSAANNKGTVLASVPIYGTGLGPQIAFGPGVLGVVDAAAFDGRINAAGLQDPSALAVNGEGDLYILDLDSDPTGYRLVMVPASGAKPASIDPSVNGDALYLPSCIAIDGAGDVFIGDFYSRVVEAPAGGGAATAIAPVVGGIALGYPSGLAVDGAGDLFIGDFMNNRVVEAPAGGGAAIAIDPTVNGKQLSDPHGLALDAAGDLFIADMGNGRVVEIAAGGGAATAIDATVNGVGLENPEDVAVDAAGDLFIADNVNHRVVEFEAGGATTAIDPALYDGGVGEVFRVALDDEGNVYIVDGGSEGGHNVVEELERAQAPAFAFSTVTDTGTTDAADGSQTVQVFNIGNQALSLTGVSFPADFSAASGDANACAGGMSLGAGQGCDVAIEFSPQQSGALSESVTLTDDAQNVSGAEQQIVVRGTGETEAVMTSPAPGSVLPGPTVTFTWSAGTGVKTYYLSLGSTGPGSSDLFKLGNRAVTSWIVTGLPTNGETIYARLTSNLSGAQIYSDYVFTAATQAALVSPVPGGALPGASATFTWMGGTGATGFSLWLGSKGAGSNDVYSSGQVTATSADVAGIPTNGETIYARLFTNFNGVQVYADSIYTAASAVVVTPASPATPGTALRAHVVRFVP